MKSTMQKIGETVHPLIGKCILIYCTYDKVYYCKNCKHGLIQVSF